MNARPWAEWAAKAESDFEAAKDLARRRVHPLPDQVAYLSEQCAEKYLKAFLVAHGIVPPKVHNLGRLNDMCAEIDANLSLIRVDVELLNPYGINIRYPGEEATPDDAKNALLCARRVRELIRRRLATL
jgi:HEPN domain-containing protein